jgi:hypothetical protein
VLEKNDQQEFTRLAPELVDDKNQSSARRPTNEELDDRRLPSFQLLGAIKPESLKAFGEDLNDRTTFGFLGTFTAQSKNLALGSACNPLILLVAGVGFEPTTFGL